MNTTFIACISFLVASTPYSTKSNCTKICISARQKLQSCSQFCWQRPTRRAWWYLYISLKYVILQARVPTVGIALLIMLTERPLPDTGFDYCIDYWIGSSQTILESCSSLNIVICWENSSRTTKENSDPTTAPSVLRKLNYVQQIQKANEHVSGHEKADRHKKNTSNGSGRRGSVFLGSLECNQWQGSGCL